jgi:hypothetical protein
LGYGAYVLAYERHFGLLFLFIGNAAYTFDALFIGHETTEGIDGVGRENDDFSVVNPGSHFLEVSDVRIFGMKKNALHNRILMVGISGVRI